MFNVITSGYSPVTYKTFKFSGGEIQVKLDFPTVVENASQISIEAMLHSADEIIELLLLVDALRRVNSQVKLVLSCPYLPYARQDRVCYPGEALSLRVMCDLINGMRFERVTICDVHSDVALALLNNVECIHQATHVKKVVEGWTDVILVSPDAGSTKKILEVAKATGLPFVHADKVRDPKDGSITGTTVYSEHIGDKNFLIADDICDGGKTFIELAKVLRTKTTGRIYLYVTHGIFSKGLSVFNEMIDHIYAAHVFPGVDCEAPILTVLCPERKA